MRSSVYDTHDLFLFNEAVMSAVPGDPLWGFRQFQFVTDGRPKLTFNTHRSSISEPVLEVLEFGIKTPRRNGIVKPVVIVRLAGYKPDDDRWLGRLTHGDTWELGALHEFFTVLLYTLDRKALHWQRVHVHGTPPVTGEPTTLALWYEADPNAIQMAVLPRLTRMTVRRDQLMVTDADGGGCTSNFNELYALLQHHS